MSHGGGRTGLRGSRGARGRPRPFLESWGWRVPPIFDAFWGPFGHHFRIISQMFAGFSLQDFMLISKPVFVDILDASLFNLGSILNPKIDLGGAPAGKRRHCKTFVFLKENHTFGAWRAPRDYQNRPTKRHRNSTRFFCDSGLQNAPKSTPF